METKKENKYISAINTRKIKKIDNTPFDTAMIPPKQNLFFTPIMWLLCWIVTRGTGLKIEKINMEGLKPPFLVLGSHHSFTDFYVTPLALKPYRANYISELEGFEAFGEWLYRQVGCLGTRKFINDTDLVRNIKRCMQRDGILVLYPEARYANVGTSSEIPDSVGKLIKFLKVPVVVINMHGNYLQSPIWNLDKRKDARLKAELTQVLTVDDVKSKSKEEIMDVVTNALKYDEYKWQQDNGIKIRYKNRAKGLHLPLYQCPVCKTEFKMDSEGTKLFCKACGAKWEKDEDSRMILEEAAKKPEYKKGLETYDEKAFSSITYWYEWQRANVNQEIDDGAYSLDCEVHIEALPNAKNFIDLGEGRLVHKDDGFYLDLKDYLEEETKTRFFSSMSLFSIHTEYNYRDKGQCVTLSTPENTYFLFPTSEDAGFNATKIQFAVEYLWKKAQKNKNN